MEALHTLNSPPVVSVNKEQRLVSPMCRFGPLFTSWRLSAVKENVREAAGVVQRFS